MVTVKKDILIAFGETLAPLYLFTLLQIGALSMIEYVRWSRWVNTHILGISYERG